MFENLSFLSSLFKYQKTPFIFIFEIFLLFLLCLNIRKSRSFLKYLLFKIVERCRKYQRSLNIVKCTLVKSRKSSNILEFFPGIFRITTKSRTNATVHTGKGGRHPRSKCHKTRSNSREHIGEKFGGLNGSCNSPTPPGRNHWVQGYYWILPHGWGRQERDRTRIVRGQENAIPVSY